MGSVTSKARISLAFGARGNGTDVEQEVGAMRIADMIRRDWWAPSLVLVMVLVAAAVGLCVFDGHDHHGQGPSLDLCVMALNVSFASMLLAGPLLGGWAAGALMAPVRSAWTTVLAPPPRSL